MSLKGRIILEVPEDLVKHFLRDFRTILDVVKEGSDLSGESVHGKEPAPAVLVVRPAPASTSNLVEGPLAEEVVRGEASKIAGESPAYHELGSTVF